MLYVINLTYYCYIYIMVAHIRPSLGCYYWLCVLLLVLCVTIGYVCYYWLCVFCINNMIVLYDINFNYCDVLHNYLFNFIYDDELLCIMKNMNIIQISKLLTRNLCSFHGIQSHQDSLNIRNK